MISRICSCLLPITQQIASTPTSSLIHKVPRRLLCIVSPNIEKIQPSTSRYAPKTTETLQDFQQDPEIRALCQNNMQKISELYKKYQTMKMA